MFGGKVLFLCLMQFWFVCLFVNLNVIWLFLCITELFFNDNLVATWNITIVFILLFLKFPFLYSLLIVLYYRRRFSVHYILQAEYIAPEHLPTLSFLTPPLSLVSLLSFLFDVLCFKIWVQNPNYDSNGKVIIYNRFLSKVSNTILLFHNSLI